ncbi:hypothetical protein PLESTB_001446600 [Pleodorina starrii]|uniref:BTB domain-containing protein n=1 Tax=Pleodorina starrii TaxID=330485 RepID=A0A9W6BVP3_9CHLO|nr:hypothetical protein PLESTB_001446600 [Pleodorina starrii]GLC68297.1 hypothetical protein PLESTF_000673300 [Pleodorina starrii]
MRKRPQSSPLLDGRTKRRKTAQLGTGSSDEPLPADGGMAIGDLPAHTFVLCGGSERFQAQIDRWGQEQAASGALPPVLRVPLDDPADLPHALAAIKFMYTGKIDPSDLPSLLRVRRLAAYLQVEGCTEACDAALIASIQASTPGQPPPRKPSQKQQQAQQQTGWANLAGVLQVYHHRDQLRTELESAAWRKVLHACRKQLGEQAALVAPDRQQQQEQQQQQQQQGEVAPAGAEPPPTNADRGPPSLGQLLTWAFGDAPSLMNAPEVRKQMEDLPAAAMEVLLGCDSFATDDEATVLLMLLTWLKANSHKIGAEPRKRLLKLVRLSMLNITYLFRILPMMPQTVGISNEELRFLQEYSFSSADEQASMRKAAENKYDFKSGWYATAWRPNPHDQADGGGGSGEGGSGRSCNRHYDWHIDAAKLEEALRETAVQQQQPSTGRLVVGSFSGGLSRVLRYGVEWYPVVRCVGGQAAAGIYLYSSLPSVLGLNGVSLREAVVLAQPGPCRLEVYKWRGEEEGGGRQVAWRGAFTDQSAAIGAGRGWATAWPLKAQPTVPTGQGPEAADITDTVAPLAAAAAPADDDPQQPQQPLASWMPYLKDGKLWGCLRYGRRGQLFCCCQAEGR